jgi:hypothetical protein
MPKVERFPRATKIFVIALTSFLILSSLIPAGVSYAAPQPKVKWSEQRVVVELPQGAALPAR